MIRAARREDADAVLALWADARSAHAMTTDSRERVDALIEAGALLVAGEDGAVGGLWRVMVDRRPELANGG